MHSGTSLSEYVDSDRVFVRPQPPSPVFTLLEWLKACGFFFQIGSESIPFEPKLFSSFFYHAREPETAQKPKSSIVRAIAFKTRGVYFIYIFVS